MTSYFAMINAWSLAWEALYGDMDKEYPIKNESYDDFENPVPPQDVDMSVGAGNTAFEDDGLDYEIDTMADIDDQYSQHYTSEEIYDAVWGDGIKYTTYDDGMSLQVKE